MDVTSVKIFEEKSIEDLEAAINEFIAKSAYKVADIKYYLVLDPNILLPHRAFVLLGP